MATAVWIFIVGAAFLSTACSESVIDNSYCEQYDIHCPRKSDPSYKTYCCVDSNGGAVLYSCCNPYFGLYIAIGVGVPVIIAVVVCVVATYCVCIHHHNRKMRALLAAYHARREQEMEERSASTNPAAPPPYTQLEGEENGEDEGSTPGRDPELPQYSERDPYNSLKIEGGSETAEQQTEGENDSLHDEGISQLSDVTPLIAGQT